MRRAIFVLVGAVLFGSATFFYGLILFQNWDGSLKELAIWLVVVGTIAGALLGLLAARVTAPSASWRTPFIVFGTVAGLLAGFVYAFHVDEVCVGGGIDCDYWGWPFLWGVWVSPWITLALWTLAGGVVGGILGVTAALFFRGVRRRKVIIGAIVLVVATAAITLFIVDAPAWNDEMPEGGLAPVIISTEAIPANQLLDPLIDQGIFEEIQIPPEAYVDGAIVDVRQLHGMTTLTPILRNEQISTSRLMIRGNELYPLVRTTRSSASFTAPVPPTMRSEASTTGRAGVE